jgi:hypothetical protein
LTQAEQQRASLGIGVGIVGVDEWYPFHRCRG